jgi:threonine dehydrogenase-like Zn-dependent dehydrogenase
MTMRSAWLMGAGRVIAVDRLSYRLEFARSWAGAETFNFQEGGDVDVVGYLRALCDGRGPDVCIDAVGCEARGSALHSLLGATRLQAGTAIALTWAIQAVRRGGNVVMIGVYGPPWNLLPIGDAMNKGLTLRGAQCNVKTLHAAPARSHPGGSPGSEEHHHASPAARTSRGRLSNLRQEAG